MKPITKTQVITVWKQPPLLDNRRLLLNFNLIVNSTDKIGVNYVQFLCVFCTLMTLNTYIPLIAGNLVPWQPEGFWMQDAPLLRGVFHILFFIIVFTHLDAQLNDPGYFVYWLVFERVLCFNVQVWSKAATYYVNSG